MTIAAGRDPDLIRFLPDVFLLRQEDGPPAAVLAGIVERWWPELEADARAQLVELLGVLLEPLTYPNRTVTWELRDRCTALVEGWLKQQRLPCSRRAP